MRADLPSPLTVALLALAAAVPFVALPGLDRAVSGLFFDGKSFAGGPWSETFRFALWRFSALVLFVAFVAWMVTLFRKSPVLRGGPRFWALIVLTYALGPGLMADGLLKRFWGRARPADVTDFGGSAQYSMAFLPTDQCLSNCSFVSGEVAGATATAIALALFIRLWRSSLTPLAYRALMVLACALPLLSALQRISSGRHFLSDAVFAGLFTLLIACLLGRALARGESPVK